MAPDAPSHGAGLDKVTLNSQDYYIRGPVRAGIVSEFEDGFKIGKATYDTRENAFFLVMDDFSGGIGKRRLDVLDYKGQFWDASATQAPDQTRPGHLTIGPYHKETILAQARNYGWVHQPSGAGAAVSVTDTIQNGSMLIGVGANIYKLNATTEAWSLIDTGGADAAEVQAIISYVEPSGTTTLFAFYSSSTGALTGTARYKKSTDGGATWSNGATDKVLYDAIFWDGKIIAVWGSKIIYGTVTAGVESWNVDDANDGVAITSTGSTSAGESFARFIGVAEAPWGQPAIYFHTDHSLYVLDFYTRKSYAIDTGLANRINSACLWNGDIYMSDCWMVMRYEINSRTVTNVGFPANEGIPPSFVGRQIQSLCPSDNTLYAIGCGDGVARVAVYQMKSYRIGAWSRVASESISTPAPPATGTLGIVNGLYSHTAVNYIGTTVGGGVIRKLLVICAACYGVGAVTNFYVQEYKLPFTAHVPLVGGDFFEDCSSTPAQFTTGWIDGGFLEVQGTAFRMFIDAFNLSTTEKVKVEYQKDNDESGSWVQMVDSSNVAAYFDSTHTTLYFSATDPLKGVQFRTVRFRISLYNRTGSAGTIAYSPEVRALVFVYFKKPDLRRAVSFVVDVSRMIQERVQVNSADATFASVWASLQTIWGTRPLVDFTFTNVVATSMRVMIQRLDMNVDNMRSTSGQGVAGTGTISVTLIEPLGNLGI